MTWAISLEECYSQVWEANRLRSKCATTHKSTTSREITRRRIMSMPSGRHVGVATSGINCSQQCLTVRCAILKCRMPLSCPACIFSQLQVRFHAGKMMTRGQKQDKSKCKLYGCAKCCCWQQTQSSGSPDHMLRSKKEAWEPWRCTCVYTAA